MGRHTVTIEVETGPDVIESIISVLETILPYMADNVVVTSKGEG